MPTRIEHRTTTLTDILPFLGQHVTSVFLSDEDALKRLSDTGPSTRRDTLEQLLTGVESLVIPTEVRSYFERGASEDLAAFSPLQLLLLQGIEHKDASVLTMLDAYARAALDSQDELEYLLCYPFHGGIIPWSGIRGVLRDVVTIQSELLQAAMLDRAVAFLLWYVADALVDRAVDQHGWYHLYGACIDMPQEMQDYTPAWLLGENRQEVFFTEIHNFPLSQRALLFLDDLADAGQREFPDDMCETWKRLRSQCNETPPLHARTYVYAEAYALEDEERAQAFNERCIKAGLPPYFAEQYNGDPLPHDLAAPYLVDMLDIPLLSAVAGPFFADWLLDKPLQEAVCVRVRPCDDVALLAQHYRKAGFVVAPFPDKLLVQVPSPKLVEFVRECESEVAYLPSMRFDTQLGTLFHQENSTRRAEKFTKSSSEQQEDGVRLAYCCSCPCVRTALS